MLMKIVLTWTVVAWVATTWVGSVMGFLFAWAGIMMAGSILVAVGDRLPPSLPGPEFILWAIWAILFGMALVGMMVAWLKGRPRQLERTAALAISLLALLIVVHLSLGTMASRWQ